MRHVTDDVRIEKLSPLLPPGILMEEYPLSERASEVVSKARAEATAILNGEDDRLLVVAGPCSIHDPAAALEYAHRLKAVADQYADDLCIIMRIYFEKPRTTIGWKGLINDPDLDGSFRINQGLRRARGLLRDVAELGLAAGTEFLDPITPQFIADLVAWGAIGARTTESQVHRQLASGLSMPVGFKNGTGGSVQLAVDAVASATHPHRFLSVTKQGLAAIVSTRGNPACHVILRGGSDGPNYHTDAIKAAITRLEARNLKPRLMVDCSHGNSGKDHLQQVKVHHELAAQIAEGCPIFGIMQESFLFDGRQDHAPGKSLVYGQSITDKCMGWDRAYPLFEVLAQAVRARR